MRDNEPDNQTEDAFCLYYQVASTSRPLHYRLSRFPIGLG